MLDTSHVLLDMPVNNEPSREIEEFNQGIQTNELLSSDLQLANEESRNQLLISDPDVSSDSFVSSSSESIAEDQAEAIAEPIGTELVVL